MTLIFDITRHFINKGIDVIIQSSIAADVSLVNDIRCKLFSNGRNLALSKAKRDELASLKNTTQNMLECNTDELSVSSLGGQCPNLKNEGSRCRFF